MVIWHQSRELQLILSNLSTFERENIWKTALRKTWGRWPLWPDIFGGMFGAFVAFIGSRCFGIVGYHMYGMFVGLSAGIGTFLGGRIRVRYAMRQVRVLLTGRVIKNNLAENST